MSFILTKQSKNCKIELRKKTGAGMMDCKKALTESNGDMEGAIDLRKRSKNCSVKRR